MSYTNHNAKDVAASGVVKAGHGVIVSVHVTKAGASGDKVVFRNGDANTDTVEFSVYGEGYQNIEDIYRRFENGIFAEVTGSTAKYLVVFK